MKLTTIFITFLFSQQLLAKTINLNPIENLKQEIFDTASQYTGFGDPDFLIQDELDVLVQELLRLSPQKPVEKRLDLLDGAWKQIWGAYDYRSNEDRGVDPKFADLENIYQVVFKEGYYYNVSRSYKNLKENKIRINLLRGEFDIVDRQKNDLKVEFTKFPGLKTAPTDVELWELAALEEQGKLNKKDRVTIVPTFIVRLFFGGGILKEVYTDENMRITYTQENGEEGRGYLYIFKKVN